MATKSLHISTAKASKAWTVICGLGYAMPEDRLDRNFAPVNPSLAQEGQP